MSTQKDLTRSKARFPNNQGKMRTILHLTVVYAHPRKKYTNRVRVSTRVPPRQSGVVRIFNPILLFLYRARLRPSTHPTLWPPDLSSSRDARPGEPRLHTRRVLLIGTSYPSLAVKFIPKNDSVGE